MLLKQLNEAEKSVDKKKLAAVVKAANDTITKKSMPKGKMAVVWVDGDDYIGWNFEKIDSVKVGDTMKAVHKTDPAQTILKVIKE